MLLGMVTAPWPWAACTNAWQPFPLFFSPLLFRLNFPWHNLRSFPVTSYLGKEMQWTHPMWLRAQKGEETPCTPRVSSRWGHWSHVLLQFPHFHAQLQSVTFHCWWPLVCHLGKAHPDVPAHRSAQPGSWAVFHFPVLGRTGYGGGSRIRCCSALSGRKSQWSPTHKWSPTHNWFCNSICCFPC